MSTYSPVVSDTQALSPVRDVTPITQDHFGAVVTLKSLNVDEDADVPSQTGTLEQAAGVLDAMGITSIRTPGGTEAWREFSWSDDGPTFNRESLYAAIDLAAQSNTSFSFTLSARAFKDQVEDHSSQVERYDPNFDAKALELELTDGQVNDLQDFLHEMLDYAQERDVPIAHIKIGNEVTFAQKTLEGTPLQLTPTEYGVIAGDLAQVVDTALDSHAGTAGQARPDIVMELGALHDNGFTNRIIEGARNDIQDPLEVFAALDEDELELIDSIDVHALTLQGTYGDFAVTGEAGWDGPEDIQIKPGEADGFAIDFNAASDMERAYTLTSLRVSQGVDLALEDGQSDIGDYRQNLNRPDMDGVAHTWAGKSWQTNPVHNGQWDEADLLEATQDKLDLGSLAWSFPKTDVDEDGVTGQGASLENAFLAVEQMHNFSLSGIEYGYLWTPFANRDFANLAGSSVADGDTALRAGGTMVSVLSENLPGFTALRLEPNMAEAQGDVRLRAFESDDEILLYVRASAMDNEKLTLDLSNLWDGSSAGEGFALGPISITKVGVAPGADATDPNVDGLVTELDTDDVQAGGADAVLRLKTQAHEIYQIRLSQGEALPEVTLPTIDPKPLGLEPLYELDLESEYEPVPEKEEEDESLPNDTDDPGFLHALFEKIQEFFAELFAIFSSDPDPEEAGDVIDLEGEAMLPSDLEPMTPYEAQAAREEAYWEMPPDDDEEDDETMGDALPSKAMAGDVFDPDMLATALAA